MSRSQASDGGEVRSADVDGPAPHVQPNEGALTVDVAALSSDVSGPSVSAPRWRGFQHCPFAAGPPRVLLWLLAYMKWEPIVRSRGLPYIHGGPRIMILGFQYMC